MRKPSMGGRQHWVMLVYEATKYKKNFFSKKKNEQVKPIIDWIKDLKARHQIHTANEINRNLAFFTLNKTIKDDYTPNKN